MLWTLLLSSMMAFAMPSSSSGADTGGETSSYAKPAKMDKKPYVFGWTNHTRSDVQLRGGTTKGPPVRLSTEPSDEWNALQEEGLSDFERDRRAILALQGDYRVSFDFLEVEVYDTGAPFATPYRSWATERVIVLEDSKKLISLQHILVMFVEMDDGTVEGPMLIKHWRQDWEYEPKTALEFVGYSHWENRPLSTKDRSGSWQQTVYQVDDSPRYAMRGTWTHNRSFSAWDSDNAWRPLPRRERTVRSDYHTMTGTNRLTILPTGWVHSQDNTKTVLSSVGTIDDAKPAVAREFGVNRYERIVGFDFSEAERYWSATSGYWKRVRKAWDKHTGQADSVRVDAKCNDVPVYALLFEVANEVDSETGLKKADELKRVNDILSCSVSVPQ